MRRSWLLVPLLFQAVLFSGSTALAREAPGRIEGQIVAPDGAPVAGVDVTISGTSRTTVSDVRGSFELKNVRAGTYALTFDAFGRSTRHEAVVVEPGATTRVDHALDRAVGLVETVTVRSVSRRLERVVDAPAAVTTVEADAIEREASHGQLPKLLEFTPGLSITQSGVYDFNLNTRGFNGALNKRVAVLVDGRDTTDPFIGAPEWGVLSFPLDDVESVEMLRGPSAALYGANASGGVLSVTRRAPRDNQGGALRVTAGELDTAQADLRWAGGLGGRWYLGAVGSRRNGEDFAVSRLSSVEYSRPCVSMTDSDCLPPDVVAFPRDEIDVTNAAVRIDRYLAGGSLLTLEGGTTKLEGTHFVNPGGTRGQIIETKWPWARFNFTSEHWSVLAYRNDRDSDSLELTTAGRFGLESDQTNLELQTHWSFADRRIRLVAGASARDEHVDSPAVRGGKAETQEQAVFGQVDWQLNDRVKLVGAARWDASDLHDSRISPKASIVWSVRPEHTLRFGYNEAFQVPTYVESLLYFPLGPPVDVGSLELECSSESVVCGLDALIPLVALGNDALDLEQTTTFELGYRGVPWRSTLVTLDLYAGRNEDFVTPFLPQVGTPLGRVNQDVGLWVPPSQYSVPPDVVEAVRAAAETLLAPSGQQLTTQDDQTLILGLSLTTFGEVETRGADLGLTYMPDGPWRVSAGVSWFDFDIEDSSPGLDQVLAPNAPETKAFLGLSYVTPVWDAQVNARWVDEFLWANGQMLGDVDAYTTVDVGANYRVGEHWRAGMHVANLFDEEHWESFGGNLIDRRALGHITFLW